MGTRVREVIRCGECIRPRCIYSAAKLTPQDSSAVRHQKEEDIYTCGSPLFPETSHYYDSIVMREGLTCLSPVKVNYFAGKTISFPEVCFHCGTKENISLDDSIQMLKRRYTTVRPICSACQAAGREPAVRGETNVGEVSKDKIESLITTNQEQNRTLFNTIKHFNINI